VRPGVRGGVARMSRVAITVVVVAGLAGCWKAATPWWLWSQQGRRDWRVAGVLETQAACVDELTHRMDARPLLPGSPIPEMWRDNDACGGARHSVTRWP
jgi:hypothetical protein